MAEPSPRPAGRPRVVALGGGHGLYASLSALRLLDVDVTAVVTVADDGGSSGRIRRELGVLPPGDLRMALAALAERRADRRATLPGPTVLQHRLRRRRRAGRPPGRQPAADRPAGTARRPGDRPWTASAGLVGARGRVLPMSARPLDLVAEVDQRRPGRPGARRAGSAASRRSPPPPAGCARSGCCPRTRRPARRRCAAILAADAVILGPGLLVHQRDPAPAGARTWPRR